MYQQQMHPAEKTWITMVFVGMSFLCFAVVAGIALVEASLAMAVALLYGFSMFYVAMPEGLKKAITSKPLMYVIDLAVSFSVPGVLGFTLTGVLGGVILGALCSLCLRFEHMRLRRMFSWQKRLYRS